MASLTAEGFGFAANLEPNVQTDSDALTNCTCCTLAVSGIFGQKLEETVRYERRYGNKLAPMLVEQCVDFIRRWGLQEEGLFRLPGQANLVKELQDAFDCGEKPAFDW